MWNLPIYYVESNHEAIIDVDTFQKVQKEINCRANHYKPTSGTKEYIFTSKIECGICGKNYRRKIAESGTKYEKPIWICSTFNYYGKKYCPSSIIPEEILEKLSCETLGIAKFDEQIFKNKVSKIVVPSKGKLKFILNYGDEVLRTWEYPSRRDSWTEEIKQMAKVRQERMTQSEHGTSSNCNSGNA